jgi:hypothetical protein
MTTRLLGFVIALALVAAACGGGDDAGSGVASLEDAADRATEAADTEEVNPAEAEDALLEFAQCMREQGVDMEDPTVDADGNLALGFRAGGAGDVDFETVEAARQACEVHLEGVTRGFRRGDDTEFQDTLLEFAQCMRDNGIDMPDPDFSSFGPGNDDEGQPGAARGPLGELDPNDPQFESAMEACEELLPGFGRAPGGPRGAAEGGDG